MIVVHGFERSVVTEFCRSQQFLEYANFLLKRSSPVRKLGAAQPPLLYARGGGVGGGKQGIFFLDDR